MDEATLEIEALGARGDGIANHDGRAIYVPYTVPGDQIEAHIDGARAVSLTVKKSSANRVAPVCQHFGDCGGCTMQHVDEQTYTDWKASIVLDALQNAGIDIDLQPIITCNPNSRRRAVFSVVVKDGGVDVGFQRAGSNHVVNIAECHVMTARLFAARNVLAALAKTFLPRGKIASFTTLESRTGYDIAVAGDFKINEEGKRAASAFCVEHNIARLSIKGETIIETKPPIIELSGFTVRPAAGGFLQAVQSIEDTMVELVCTYLSKSKRVADLFCGSGTFALPLSRTSTVTAIESENFALQALDGAWRNATGQKLKQIHTEKRDLHNRPMMAAELDDAKIQGIVFDPPRAGAEMQAKQLAKSKVRHIAAVSCNPTTLARDLSILIDGGYTLQSVTPLDQFLWTPHVEVVALLNKGKKTGISQ